MQSIYDLSPAIACEKACVKRAQVWLDTGYYPEGEYNKIWDILAWVDAQDAKK